MVQDPTERQEPAHDAGAAPGAADEEPGRLKGLKRWARHNAPPVHTFLTSQDKPYPLLREFAVGAVVLLAAAALLWGGTGQSVGETPVVVIESGSMMHCDQGRNTPSPVCDGTFARLGTIDPGDLVFVRDVDGRGDVATFAQEARCEASDFDERDCRCDHDSYGRCGDVIIYRPSGSDRSVPVIHRAMFWLEVHGDGTFSVPECGIERVPREDLTNICIASMNGDDLAGAHALDGLGPEDSGFITLGDNNGHVDVPNLTSPVRPEWILGKARGEVPWVGLVKLGVSDFLNGCGRDVRIPCNYDNAPPDVKTMMWVTIAALVAAPFVVEKVQAYRHRNDEE